MNKKDVKNPKEASVPRKDPQVLFNELIAANNLVITVTPNTNIKVVSDGSMIVDAPFISVRYKDGQNR